jgi:hypothetical protein
LLLIKYAVEKEIKKIIIKKTERRGRKKRKQLRKK